MDDKKRYVLKCSQGLIKLLRCSICGYMVKIEDMNATHKDDSGEVRCCKWCGFVNISK